jgi:hypothetical protein
MGVMRTLERPETIETKHGLKKVTHEVYCFSITPFLSPPITVMVYKGSLDAKGNFQVLAECQSTISINQEEFRWLLNPTPQGKPAGDFRLSDVLVILKGKGQAGT